MADLNQSPTQSPTQSPAETLTPTAPDLNLPLPLSAGGVTLALRPPGPIWSVSPLKKARPASLRKLALPDIGACTETAFWAGHRQWFLRDGPAPRGGGLAVTDQSGGWVIFEMSGERAADVLARLCPLDLRPQAFADGSAARTEFAHMMALVARLNGRFEIWIMRSFAQTAAHHIHDAMQSVAAQGR